MRKLIFATVIVCFEMFLGGCSSMSEAYDRALGRPYTLSANEMEQYATIGALIDDTTTREYRTTYTWKNHARIIQPYQYAYDYCAYQNGTLVRTQKTEGPTTDPRYRSSSNAVNKEKSFFQKAMELSFGEFECHFFGGVPAWAIQITASAIEHLKRHDTYNRPTQLSNLGEASITVGTYDSGADLMAYRAEQRQQKDVLLESAAQRNEALLAASRRGEELETVARAEKDRQRIEAQVEMLTSLELGTETHCGMVIDLRENLVEVQTEVAGNRWFKRGELHAAGHAPCRFQNGQYQEPF